MKSELTNDEYKIIYNYANAQMNNPCRNCPNDIKATCCGCDKAKDFTLTYKPVIYTKLLTFTK